MRQFCLIFLSLVIVAPAMAAQDPQAVIAAAAASAVSNLNSDICSEPIRTDLTVSTFLDRTSSHPRLLALLKQAQQIGGPRWIDAQTCQIRLDIPALAVRSELQRIAQDHVSDSPIGANELVLDLQSWDARIFSATGTSTASIDQILPPVGSVAWQGVSSQEVRQDVQSARQDAGNRILGSIQSIPLAGGKTIGDALAIVAVRQAVNDWIISQPITLAVFRDDRQVEVTVAVSAAGLAEKLRSVLTGRTDLPLPENDQGWASIADAISGQMAAPVGRAGSAAPDTQPEQLVLPDPPPDWIFRQLDASASGNGDTPLLAARQAEEAATENLRQQIEKLPLTSRRTLGDAAASYPQITAAIDRTLVRSAHVYSVDYQTDGSVNVRISLDLQDLWQMLWLMR
jgi:hypothetical protein